jgi:hypothetical protein
LHGRPAEPDEALAPILHFAWIKGRREPMAPPTIGHNGGPPLEEELRIVTWQHYCWRKSHAKAWKTPPREIALARLARAEALGMSYRAYTAIVLDTGVHL